jgi:uroporphyrinogen-III decarboxylase
MKTGNEWKGLSPEERREDRFSRWFSPPGIQFNSSEAEGGYKARVTRFVKAIKLEEPDRVPVMLPVQFFPAAYAGGSLKKVMYDYEELKRSWLMFLHDFEMDSFIGCGLVLSGRMLEMIDYKLQVWPGHGLADDIPSYQYVESENMKPEEYDALINDPTDFLLRTFLPRSSGAFAGFSKLSQMTPFIGIPVYYINQFGDPEIRASVRALLDAAQEGLKWQAAVMEVWLAGLEQGIPNIWGGMCGAPFDLIGDILRGTKGIMMDMYQRPDKLIEAMERITPIVVDEAIGSANATGCPIIFMPLHKGTGGFMSPEQFETFYWPTLKKVMMGLIEEGLVPMPYAEGDYITRLQTIRDMPRGKVVWFFERMDMAKAKEVLGDNACLAGNVPASVLYTGTPQEVKEESRKLIEICAKGGGYILSGAVHMDEGNPENLRAIMEAAKEYGVYS